MRFELTGQPIANQRHRHKLMVGKVWTFDPQAKLKQQLKRQLSIQADNQHYPFPSSGPIEISMTFHIQPAPSTPKPKHNILIWSQHHTKKPDLDNYEKFIMDIGTSVLWPDDCQIASIKSLKINSPTPKTIIEVKDLSMDLDEQTTRILALFSPDGLHDLVSELLEVQRLLSPYPRSFEEDCRFPNKLRAETSARILKRLAHTYAADLTKIKKITQATT